MITIRRVYDQEKTGEHYKVLVGRCSIRSSFLIRRRIIHKKLPA